MDGKYFTVLPDEPVSPELVAGYGKCTSGNKTVGLPLP